MFRPLQAAGPAIVTEEPHAVVVVLARQERLVVVPVPVLHVNVFSYLADLLRRNES